MRSPKITDVIVERVRGTRPDPLPGPAQRQVQALDIYADEQTPIRIPAGQRPVPDPVLISYYLRIQTDTSLKGLYGPIDLDAGMNVLRIFRPLLIGQDALASNHIWDKLERSDRHARFGALKIAISAIDNALWDLRGKHFDAPVWQLLGGGSRRRIPAYASMLGTPIDEATVRERSLAARDEGYAGQKWFFEYGPGAGSAGLEQCVQLVRTVRDAVGPDEPIMFDAYHGWDLPFARAWAERVVDAHPTWLEEAFLPNRHAAFLELHRSTGIPLATGEHIYERAEVLELLNTGILVAIQCDPEWCGGVTELVKICAIAETFGVPVIPHGHGVHAALHVVASQSPEVCPKVEYLVRLMPVRHHFERTPPTPVRGAFELPSGPGFGIELDEDKIESRDQLMLHN